MGSRSRRAHGAKKSQRKYARNPKIHRKNTKKINKK